MYARRSRRRVRRLVVGQTRQTTGRKGCTVMALREAVSKVGGGGKTVPTDAAGPAVVRATRSARINVVGSCIHILNVEHSQPPSESSYSFETVR